MHRLRFLRTACRSITLAVRHCRLLFLHHLLFFFSCCYNAVACTFKQCLPFYHPCCSILPLVVFLRLRFQRTACRTITLAVQHCRLWLIFVCGFNAPFAVLSPLRLDTAACSFYAPCRFSPYSFYTPLAVLLRLWLHSPRVVLIRLWLITPPDLLKNSLSRLSFALQIMP